MLYLFNPSNPVLNPHSCPVLGIFLAQHFALLIRPFILLHLKNLPLVSGLFFLLILMHSISGFKTFLLHLQTPFGLGLFTVIYEYNLSRLSLYFPSWLVLAWRWRCRFTIFVCRHLRAFCRRQASGPELPTTGAGHPGQPLGPPPPVEEPMPAGLVVSKCS